MGKEIFGAMGVTGMKSKHWRKTKADEPFPHILLTLEETGQPEVLLVALKWGTGGLFSRLCTFANDCVNGNASSRMIQNQLPTIIDPIFPTPQDRRRAVSRRTSA